MAFMRALKTIEVERQGSLCMACYVREMDLWRDRKEEGDPGLATLVSEVQSELGDSMKIEGSTRKTMICSGLCKKIICKENNPHKPFVNTKLRHVLDFLNSGQVPTC